MLPQLFFDPLFFGSVGILGIAAKFDAVALDSVVATKSTVIKGALGSGSGINGFVTVEGLLVQDTCLLNRVEAAMDSAQSYVQGLTAATLPMVLNDTTLDPSSFHFPFVMLFQ